MAEPKMTSEDSIPFYPEHVRTEAKVVVGVLVVVLIVAILGLLKPVGLGEPADPMNTPLHVKPEWYFLALYQLLKYIPKTTGAVIPVIFVAIVALWPFLDQKPDTSPKNTRTRFIAIVIGVVILVGLTLWGAR